MSHLLGATPNENMLNHGNYKRIMTGEENKAVKTSSTLPTLFGVNPNTAHREDVCLVKVRAQEGLCTKSKLPHGKYVTFTCGRPDQLPSSVNVLLWGGLSGYCQELQRKQSREIQSIAIVIFWIPMFIVNFFLPFVGYDRSSDIVSWCNNLLTWFFLFSLMYISNVVTEKFDTEMHRIVSTKLRPVFRTYGHSELRYFSGRSFGSSYAYFTVKNLSTTANTSNEEEQQTVSNDTMVNMDDDDEMMFGSSSASDSTTFGNNSTVPCNEIFIPIFGTKYYNRGLEISERPKELNVNMFVWGMIVECFQKVELSPRQRQRVKAMGIIFFIWFMSFLVSVMFLTAMVFDDNEYWITLVLAGCCCYPVGWFLAMLIEPYPSSEQLHQEYEHVLDEIAPLIEQNSIYCVKYMIANNGRSGQLVFRLKHNHHDQVQQDNHGTISTGGSSGIV